MAFKARAAFPGLDLVSYSGSDSMLTCCPLDNIVGSNDLLLTDLRLMEIELPSAASIIVL